MEAHIWDKVKNNLPFGLFSSHTISLILFKWKHCMAREQEWGTHGMGDPQRRCGYGGDSSMLPQMPTHKTSPWRFSQLQEAEITPINCSLCLLFPCLITGCLDWEVQFCSRSMIRIRCDMPSSLWWKRDVSACSRRLSFYFGSGWL